MQIVQLRKKGIFAGALIKKHRIWPVLVPGKEIALHFEGRAVGECYAILGKLDEVKYFSWGMMENDYVMKIMASGGALVSNIN